MIEFSTLLEMAICAMLSVPQLIAGGTVSLLLRLVNALNLFLVQTALPQRRVTQTAANNLH